MKFPLALRKQNDRGVDPAGMLAEDLVAGAHVIARRASVQHRREHPGEHDAHEVEPAHDALANRSR